MLYTIGHSTHDIDEFVRLLEAHAVDHVTDIRTVPRSRTNPQFNQDVLPGLLAPHGIGHSRIAQLGGLRHVRRDSINTAWRNQSFRGYADHMSTPEFAEGLAVLEETMAAHTVAIMCAEAVWWRCHRSLVADAMIARGHDVRHIMPDGRTMPAHLHDFAVVVEGIVTYPGTGDPGP